MVPRTELQLLTNNNFFKLNRVNYLTVIKWNTLDGHRFKTEIRKIISRKEIF